VARARTAEAESKARRRPVWCIDEVIPHWIGNHHSYSMSLVSNMVLLKTIQEARIIRAMMPQQQSYPCLNIVPRIDDPVLREYRSSLSLSIS
jgi:hypothetical protein